jgi:hypothetical protein
MNKNSLEKRLDKVIALCDKLDLHLSWAKDGRLRVVDSKTNEEFLMLDFESETDEMTQEPVREFPPIFEYKLKSP